MTGIGTPDIPQLKEDEPRWRVIKQEIKTGGFGNRFKNIEELLEPCMKSTAEIVAWNLFFIVGIGIVAILWSAAATLIPQHDVIKYPSFWWEGIITGSFFVTSLYETTYTLLECNLIFGFDFLRSSKTFLILWIITYLAITIPYIITYVLWSVMLGYNHPMPLVGLVAYTCWNIAHFFGIWFMFPFEVRQDHGKRIWKYILYRLWFLFMVQQKTIFMMMMGKLPSGFQWILAIALPSIREMNTWVLTKIIKKTSLSETSQAQMMILRLTPAISVNISHAFWMAIIISSQASQMTTRLILAVDFLLNLYSTYVILKLHRRISSENNEDIEQTTFEKKEETFMSFGLVTIESVAPLIYFSSFMLAYYGPNSEIIGGVKLNLWQHSPVDDIGAFSQNFFLMFAVEGVVIIISGIVLQKYAAVSFLREGYKLLKVYWPLTSTIMGGSIFQVQMI